MTCCPHCNLRKEDINSDFANHVKFCAANESVPNYKNGKGSKYFTGRLAWNKGKTKENDVRVAKSANTLMVGIKPNHGQCSDPIEETERRLKLSKIAKLNGFGGYRQNAGISKKFRVLDSYGKEVVLQSSYELKCSEILNSSNIKWIRPTALKYDNKNYFADFYLPEYDVWLDPKNAYKATLDSDKIKKVIAQNNIRLYVLLEHQLTKEYIAGII